MLGERLGERLGEVAVRFLANPALPAKCMKGLPAVSPPSPRAAQMTTRLATAGAPEGPNTATASAPEQPSTPTAAPAPTCDDCFEELAAAHACQTCHLNFCPAHAAEHRRRKSTREHHLVALGPAHL